MPGFGMPMPMPPMGGLPGGPPGGMPGMPGGMPGGADQDMALSAMSDLAPKPVNPTEALNKVSEALDKSNKLIELCLPQVSQWNPKLAKDLHAISKSILAAKLDLKKEQPPGPPPDLMLGMQGGGLPPGLGIGMGGSPPGY